GVTSFWPLLAVAFVGTVNPSAGDVTLFLPTEQAVLAEASDTRDRTGLFAWYNLTGTFAGAAGAVAAGFPDAAAQRFGSEAAQAERAGFRLCSVLGLVAAVAYARLSPAIEHDTSAPAQPLARSRGIVLKLSALFSLDSFGGGFVVQSLLVLWLFRRFALPVQVAGAIFFAAGLLAALSQFVAARLSPLLAGILLDRTSFGWPLLCAGALKALYDLLLFRQFAHLRPAEEPSEAGSQRSSLR